MGNLNPKGDLAAAQAAFFAPALVISSLIVFRHGFSRQLGWLYLVLLSILRIIGGSVTLYSETQNDYSTSLFIAAAITSAIGTAPLLLALQGILSRVNEGLREQQRNISKHLFTLLSLLLVAALVSQIDTCKGGWMSATHAKFSACYFR
jgi:hypothetical protein